MKMKLGSVALTVCCIALGGMTFDSSASSKLTNEQIKTVKSHVLSYMQTWHEEDPSIRLLELTRVTSEHFSYADPTTSALIINSPEQVNQWIGGFHKEMQQLGFWPIKAQPISNIDIHGSLENTKIRFNWQITAFNGAVILAEGVDFGTASNLKLSSITGFFGELTPICNAPNWSSDIHYLKGDLVTFNNAIFQAQWWSNTSPNNDTEAWEKLKNCTQKHNI